MCWKSSDLKHAVFGTDGEVCVYRKSDRESAEPIKPKLLCGVTHVSDSTGAWMTCGCSGGIITGLIRTRERLVVWI